MLTKSEKKVLNYVVKRIAKLSYGTAHPLDGTGFDFAATQVTFSFTWEEYNAEVHNLYPHVMSLKKECMI